MGYELFHGEHVSNPRRSLNLSAALAEAADERFEELGYPNLNAYFKALLRYDLLVSGDHSVTKPVAAMSPAAQDRFDERILANRENGEKERGSYLKWLIREMMDEAEKEPGKIEENLNKKIIE